MDNNEVRFNAREHSLDKKWSKSKNKLVTVNNQQYSFDSLNRKDQFDKNLCRTPEELKYYNWYRSEWYRRPNEFDPGEAPLAVACELVSSCNLSCSMCYTITEEFQDSTVGSQRVLPWNIVKSIIDECSILRVPSILFSWRGESSIYKSRDEFGNKVDLGDVFAYARKKGILEVTCLTHGQLLSEELIKKIVKAQPSWISFSIDGLDKAYNKIRKPTKEGNLDGKPFENVIRNLKFMKKYRDELGQTRPQIRTNSIFPPISNDPHAYHDYMKSIGVDWITVNEILDFRGENLPDSEVLDDWACQYPWQRLTISANGTILPCTGAHNEEKEMQLGRYVGSKPKNVKKFDGKREIIELPEITLSEAWKCEKLDIIRNKLKNNLRKTNPACRNCRHGAVKHGVQWVPEDWDMDKMEWDGREWRE